MATRNLARSLSEVGRVPAERQLARVHTRVERRCARVILRCVKDDYDLVDDEALVVDDILMPHRQFARPDGRLVGRLVGGRIVRFLTTHTGRPWDEVYSIIRRRFSGQSYTDAELIRFVKCKVFVDGGYDGRIFFVDNNGILRKIQKESKPKNKEVSFGKTDEKFAEWVEGREFIVRGSKLFWCVGQPSVGVVRAHCADPSCKNWHEEQVGKSGRMERACHGTKGLRQDREFEPEDYAFFATLPARLKKGYR